LFPALAGILKNEFFHCYIEMCTGRKFSLFFVSCPQETDENAVLCRSFSIFILISPINRAKCHTAVSHDCLHGMPRFNITFARVCLNTADDHRRSTQITTDHQIAYF